MVLLLILLFGTVVGGLARLLLPGRQNLSLSATIVAGLLGAATVGSAVAAITQRGFDVQAPSLIGSVVGAIGFVALAEMAIARRASRRRRTPTEELLHTGESQTVEFKSAARFNHDTGERDARLELTIARTVAGLTNAEGGTLLIGVDDHGVVLGLDQDLQLIKGGDIDRFELWLHDLLGRCLGRPALRHVSVNFDRCDDRHVCRIDVAPADAPVFLHPHTGERHAQFHIRIGNSTRQLHVDEAVDYVRSRFTRHPASRLRDALQHKPHADVAA